MASPAKGDNTKGKVNTTTSFAGPATSGERLDCPVFKREDDDDTRVMVEIPAGKNLWYQVYYEGESNNEIRLRFPALHRRDEHVEWLDKRSSRLSRVGLAAKNWRYVKGSGGGWAPRGSAKSAAAAAASAGAAAPGGGGVKKVQKKSSNGGGAVKLAGSSAPSGGTPAGSDAGDAADSDGGLSKPAPKRSRLGTAAGGSGCGARQEEASSDDSEDSSSSSGSESEDEGREELRKGMAALGEWFSRHSKALTLTLPGEAAEASGLKKAAAAEAKQRLPPGAAAALVVKGGGGGEEAAGSAKAKSRGPSDEDWHSNGSYGSARDSGGATHAATAAAPPARRHADPPPPPQPIRLTSLEEDDLFSAPARRPAVGSGGSGGAAMPPLGVSPMNSLGVGVKREPGGVGNGGPPAEAAAAPGTFSATIPSGISLDSKQKMLLHVESRGSNPRMTHPEKT